MLLKALFFTFLVVLAYHVGRSLGYEEGWAAAWMEKEGEEEDEG